MSIRKGITLAGLALAAVALGPTPALATAKDLPVRGTISGTAGVNVQTLGLTVDFTGVATHLGEYTAHQEGTLQITPEGTEGSGTVTIVAADGDQATGAFTLATPGLPTEPHTTTGVTTITGGTGRFSDASGTLRTTTETSPISFDGVTLVNSVEGTVRGRVSY